MAGPTLTRANLRDYARLLALDTSTTQPGITDANFSLLLREALFLYASMADTDEILVTSASATLSAAANTVSVAFTTTPLNVEAVYLSGVKKLKKRPLQEILDIQAELPNQTGTPEFFAIYAGGSRDSWTVYFDCKADAAYTVVLWYRAEPTVWSGDSVTTPFGDAAALVIARLAAVEAAAKLGRPQQFIDNLSAALPERFRGPLRVAFKSGTTGGTTSARVP